MTKPFLKFKFHCLKLKCCLSPLEDCNVISVDWEPLARGPNYVKAARNAMPAGARTADFLRGLMEASGAVLEDFHAIGYSLGGQHVGGLGHAMEGKMKRITALDPAGERNMFTFPNLLLLHDEKKSFLTNHQTYTNAVMEWNGGIVNAL